LTNIEGDLTNIGSDLTNIEGDLTNIEDELTNAASEKTSVEDEKTNVAGAFDSPSMPVFSSANRDAQAARRRAKGICFSGYLFVSESSFNIESSSSGSTGLAMCI
jgi:hypothetical protein